MINDNNNKSLLRMDIFKPIMIFDTSQNYRGVRRLCH